MVEMSVLFKETRGELNIGTEAESTIDVDKSRLALINYLSDR